MIGDQTTASGCACFSFFWPVDSCSQIRWVELLSLLVELWPVYWTEIAYAYDHIGFGSYVVCC